MAKLGVRPYPECSESLSGYLLRLSEVNGLINIQELQSAIGVEKSKINGWGHWSGAQINYLSGPLSDVLGRDANRHISFTLGNSMKRWQFSDRRMFKELVVDFMRVCPGCLASNKRLDWRWCIGTVARCPIHRTPLLDTCPDCGSQLRWDSNIFRGCTTCSKQWSEIDSLPASGTKFSKLEADLIPDENGDIRATSDALDKLCVAILKFARPYDCIYQVLQRIPYSLGHSDLILHVLKEIDNSSRAPRAPEPDFEINARVTDDPHLITREMVEYVRPSRKKWIRNGDLSALRYQADHLGLSEYLGVSKPDLLKVTEADLIQPINSTSIVRDQLFDVREAVKVLSVMPAPADTSGYRLLTVKDKALRSHLCKYGEVLCAVLQGEIPGYFDKGCDMSTVRVREEELSLWLARKFERECDGPVALPAASAAIGCSIEKTKKLVKSGHLALARWQRYVDAIDGPSLYALVSERHRSHD
ncbi:TniQ family protein [Marinimicrobium sp. C2-29]|uniref:TniQ family protein n=1 Tax=Marinimicrobium sp. C2-29 TaxID=3139825 RepID=UPI003138F391